MVTVRRCVLIVSTAVLVGCGARLSVAVRVENQALVPVHGATVFVGAGGVIVDEWVTDSAAPSHEVRFPATADSMVLYVVAEGYRLGCSVLPRAMARESGGPGGLTQLLSTPDSSIPESSDTYLTRCQKELDALLRAGRTSGPDI